MTISFAQIYFCELLRMQTDKFSRFLRNFFLHNSCKPEILSRTLIFTQNLLLQIDSFSTESNNWRFIKKNYIQIKHDFGFPLVTFSYKIFKLRDKNNKTEVKNLINWKLMHSNLKCLNCCVVLNFDISNANFKYLSRIRITRWVKNTSVTVTV